MKKCAALSLLMSVITLLVHAQHVGIGNTDPAHILDLSGRMRIRGGANILLSAGIWLGGTGADSAKDRIFIGMQADSILGFYSSKSDVSWGLLFDGRNGNIGLKNATPNFPISFQDVTGDKISLFHDFNGNYYGMGVGNATMQLVTPHSTSDIVFGYGKSASFNENVRIKGNGNVGIKTNPGFPLSFQDIAGDKISLYKDGNGNFYGLGIGSSLMQLMTPHSTSDIVFGYGKSAAFTENMRIKGNGNVGIGVSDPVYPLDISNRMRIRGAPGYTAGIWLNNEANTAIPAFIGMFSNNEVGFYGSGTGWSFLMNTQNGAMSFGGNTGQQGQVLTSNGTSAAPSWQGGGGGKIFIARQSTNSASIVSGQTDIPDLVANFTLPVASRVLFQYSANVFAQDCFACTPKRVSIILFQNVVGGTSELDRARASIGNDTWSTTLVSGPAVFDFPAGTYSFKVVFSCSGNANTARADFGKLSWQIFPD